MYAAEEPLISLEVRCGGAREGDGWDFYLDDAEAGKSAYIDADTAHVVVLHPFEDRRSRSHARVQVKEFRPVWDCPA